MRESVSSNSKDFNTLQQVFNRRGLVIACLNVNSLVAHIDKLRVLLCYHKIDIFCYQRTKLASPTISVIEPVMALAVSPVAKYKWS